MNMVLWIEAEIYDVFQCTPICQRRNEALSQQPTCNPLPRLGSGHDRGQDLEEARPCLCVYNTVTFVESMQYVDGMEWYPCLPPKDIHGRTSRGTSEELMHAKSRLFVAGNTGWDRTCAQAQAQD